MCPWPQCLGFRQPAAICGTSGYEPRCVVHEGKAAAGHPLPGHPPQFHHHTGQGQSGIHTCLMTAQMSYKSCLGAEMCSAARSLHVKSVLASLSAQSQHSVNIITWSRFFPPTYAHNTLSSCFSLSRSFATLFLSWQPLHRGVCVRLFVSECGYVWKCVRICLWVLALECWVRGRVNRVLK